MSIEINKNSSTNKTVVDLINSEVSRNIETVDYNGTRLGIMMWTSPEDREAGINFLKKVIDTIPNPDAMSIISTINKVTTFVEKNIFPDDVITVCGVEYYVSCKNKTLYDSLAEEVIDCRDIEGEMSDSAVKEILSSRLQLKLEKEAEECDDYESVNIPDAETISDLLKMFLGDLE